MPGTRVEEGRKTPGGAAFATAYNHQVQSALEIEITQSQAGRRSCGINLEIAELAVPVV
jgi:hypothetical protein